VNYKWWLKSGPFNFAGIGFEIRKKNEKCLCHFFVLSAPEAILARLPRFIRNDVFQAACVGYAYSKSHLSHIWQEIL